MDHPHYLKQFVDRTLSYLQGKNNILFLTTSNRWSGEEGGEMPKSTQLAQWIAEQMGKKVTWLDVPKLRIYPCEGNISTARGNTCGELKAKLKDSEKNPTGHHRCWASMNNPDDELWKISKELLQSDCVMFFTSVRWGQANAFYQKLIERLTWLENRHSTLGEENILRGIDAGLIVFGQNWHGREVLSTQKQVLSYYGFRVIEDLCWNWQYLESPEDESNESYIRAAKDFKKSLEILD